MMVALPRFSVCQERIARRKQLDVFENSPFQRKVYDLYEKVIDSDPDVHRIDTGGTLEEGAALIRAAVDA